MLPPELLGEPLQALVLALGDVLHLRRDAALAGVTHLTDGLAASRLAMEVETQLRELRVGEPPAAVLGSRAVEPQRVAARLDPPLAQRRPAPADIQAAAGVRVGARRVLDRVR